MVRFCKSAKCLIGKTIIVTGANTGIGYEAALEFAKRGGRVILACRNEEKANKARDKIVELTGNRNVVVKILDQESLESVRKFAKDIVDTESRLDVLVNNAGAYQLPEKITPDGLQLEMEVNYYSPFLLTHLLLDLLKKSAPSRIVNLSSELAKIAGKLNLDKLDSFPGHLKLYCRTKLCNIFFTVELAKRIEGTGVTTYSVHPGVVHTELQRASTLLNAIAKGVFMSPVEGAQTTIYVAIEEGIEEYNGRHFTNCKVVKPYCSAKETEMATKLYEVTLPKVGLKESL